MKIASRAENLVERIALALGLVPTPFLDTHTAMLLSRTVAAAGRAGVFAALARRPRSAAEVAAACGTAVAPTARLLEALAGAGYLRLKGGRYSLARHVRRWLTPGSSGSLDDALRWQETEWSWLEEFDRYLIDSRPVDMHARMTREQWGDYQRAMLATARILAAEVGLRTPVPRGAKRLLDVGGAHGLYSLALCRRHPGLEAVVLDLPQALAAGARPLDGAAGDRVTYRAGNVLEEDLGTGEWDVVFISQLVHHFDEETNRDLTRRVSRALRPGGALVIQDLLKPVGRRTGGQVAGLYDLYFSFTSSAGTWATEDLKDWQKAAGMLPRRAVRFVTAPGMGQQAAFKPGSSRSRRPSPPPRHEVLGN